jgi:hypothetical protein
MKMKFQIIVECSDSDDPELVEDFIKEAIEDIGEEEFTVLSIDREQL